MDLTKLPYAGQIITPEFNPVRFDTMFFMAKLPKSQIPEPHSGEIDYASWVVPREAIKGYNSEFMLAPPILHNLKAIVSFLDWGELIMHA
ncbi:hypothetical protein [Bacillus sp. B15-48]|uniref:hypothetical protein n=1 Tax=Bacillus sp. B15-48 TaxID=1548601 RepID=UPI00193FD53A|nr:hypothetical protein [Bacillus sp. B15-48]MBM4763767.1 hypothetical protein [Bacillus sp. B15-48]